MSSRGRARTGKVFWKLSISKARDDIFLHVKIPADIETAKQSKTDCIYKKGLTVQLYINVGSNLNNVHSFYMIIDNKNYQLNTLLDALIFCFQAYFALDIKYAPECQHL